MRNTEPASPTADSWPVGVSCVHPHFWSEAFRSLAKDPHPQGTF